MELKLHANATTTPKTRAYIQSSKASVAELVAELGVSETTIRRWRGRTTVTDHSHPPKTSTSKLTALEEALVCELRRAVELGLDDITEVMQRCVNPQLSRSAIHRCLVRHGLNRRPKPEKPTVGVFQAASVGFIHVDLKHLPAFDRRKSYAFVAIDRVTRYVYLEIHDNREAKTAAGFLERFLAGFPYPVHTILTDNGSEFTDRFAVDMKDKPHDKPSGRHPSTASAPGTASTIASPGPSGRRPTASSNASIAASSRPSAANPSAASRTASLPRARPRRLPHPLRRTTTIEPASSASTISPRFRRSPIPRDRTRSRGRR